MTKIIRIPINFPRIKIHPRRPSWRAVKGRRDKQTALYTAVAALILAGFYDWHSTRSKQASRPECAPIKLNCCCNPYIYRQKLLVNPGLMYRSMYVGTYESIVTERRTSHMYRSHHPCSSLLPSSFWPFSSFHLSLLYFPFNREYLLLILYSFTFLPSTSHWFLNFNI